MLHKAWSWWLKIIWVCLYPLTLLNGFSMPGHWSWSPPPKTGEVTHRVYGGTLPSHTVRNNTVVLTTQNPRALPLHNSVFLSDVVLTIGQSWWAEGSGCCALCKEVQRCPSRVLSPVDFPAPEQGWAELSNLRQPMHGPRSYLTHLSSSPGLNPTLSSETSFPVDSASLSITSNPSPFCLSQQEEFLFLSRTLADTLVLCFVFSGFIDLFGPFFFFFNFYSSLWSFCLNSSWPHWQVSCSIFFSDFG